MKALATVALSLCLISAPCHASFTRTPEQPDYEYYDGPPLDGLPNAVGRYTQPLILVRIDPNYSGGFVGSMVEEVGPGIDAALAKKGKFMVKAGTTVIVMWPDGTMALYTKTNSWFTIRWAWAGLAWDKDARPIGPDGQPTSGEPPPPAEEPANLGVVIGHIYWCPEYPEYPYYWTWWDWYEWGYQYDGWWYQ